MDFLTSTSSSHIRLTLIIAVVSLPMLAGCSTFEFVNGPELNETVKYERWHHLGLNGLVSFSQPLNVVQQCDQNQWESITIEKTFFNGIAGVSVPWFELYSPWTTVYECRPAIDVLN